VVDDFLRRRVQRPVIIRFHPNSNPITRHILLTISLAVIYLAAYLSISGIGRAGTISVLAPEEASGEI
jgi:hypothetical protein